MLSWAANNTAKLGMAAQHGDVECWTLMSTPEYGRNNKVPQEAVPPEVAERVRGRAGSAALSCFFPLQRVPLGPFLAAQNVW